MKNQRDSIKAKDVVIVNNVIYYIKGGKLLVCRSLKYVTKEGKIISSNFVRDYNKCNNPNN